MPGIVHVIYIPVILGIGIVLGWKYGAASVQNRWDTAEEKRRQREED